MKKLYSLKKLVPQPSYQTILLSFSPSSQFFPISHMHTSNDAIFVEALNARTKTNKIYRTSHYKWKRNDILQTLALFRVIPCLTIQRWRMHGIETRGDEEVRINFFHVCVCPRNIILTLCTTLFFAFSVPVFVNFSCFSIVDMWSFFRASTLLENKKEGSKDLKQQQQQQ